MNVFVDTQLWVYAFKVPQREKFTSEDEYRDALRMHSRANEFLRDALLNHMLYITTHQLAEIFHALAFEVRYSRVWSSCQRYYGALSHTLSPNPFLS